MKSMIKKLCAQAPLRWDTELKQNKSEREHVAIHVLGTEIPFTLNRTWKQGFMLCPKGSKPILILIRQLWIRRTRSSGTEIFREDRKHNKNLTSQNWWSIIKLLKWLTTGRYKIYALWETAAEYVLTCDDLTADSTGWNSDTSEKGPPV
jgi:hypothetical protein